FIIEQCIEGEEFAVDAYFDREGRPVILNILKHLFSSGEDVSDRVYITSKEIMRVFYDKFFPVLEGIGRLTGAKRFPIHAEFRINPEGVVVPIEVNPMRFAGWCTTDIAFYAFGVNVYEYFFEQKKPDWEAILSRMDDKLYSIIVGDLPKGLDPGKVDVDYHRLLSAFEHVLELRKINYRRHGVFAFVFTETRAENRQELDAILQSDLTEFVKKPR
ncbi:MAG: ATP-grasp domain-containing protein, partial [Spirochaetales bacterium]|nr:ATP-grasp domain-containing protein [Spirochaetales bacterium]